MDRINEAEKIDYTERIQARKRQIYALTTKLERVKLECEKIPLKRKAAYVELIRNLIPATVLSFVEIICLTVLISTIVNVVQAEGKVTPVDGLVILLAPLLGIYIGVYCGRYWKRVAQVIIYLKDLKDDEIQFATKRITLTGKMAECQEELENLYKKQKE